MSDKTKAPNVQTFGANEQEFALKLIGEIQAGCEIKVSRKPGPRKGQKVAEIALSEGEWNQVLYLLGRVAGESWATGQAQMTVGAG